MRYRPFGASGTSVSVLAMALGEESGGRRPTDWIALIYAALEQGINTFLVSGHSPALVEGVGQALQTVERRLVFVSWRIGRGAQPPVRDFSAEMFSRQVRAVLARTGLEYLDVAMVDGPAVGDLDKEGVAVLKQLRDGRAARMLGVAGEEAALDHYMELGAFDVMETAFNLTSGWAERNRLRAARDRDMVVIGADAYPSDFHQSVARASPRPGRDTPLAGVGTYAFLDQTPGWTAEEICLAYALTEPSLATVRIGAPSQDRLRSLAEIPERDLPPGLAAQIEMARFCPDLGPQLKRRNA